MQQQVDANSKNIIVGPDYGQMIKLQTNAAIVEAFLSMLFSKNTKFNMLTVFTMVRNMAIILVIKTMLEDSKSYLDTFKFTNLNLFRHFYQTMRYSTHNYDFVLVCGKWMYGDHYISINTLTPFLEQKSIFISQQGTYYFEYRSYLIKVVVADKKISFVVPNIDTIKKFVETDIIHRNKEIVFGGKTTMFRAIITSQSGVVKIEPIQLVYAFETSNYIELEHSIKSYFIVDAYLKFPTTPFCVNFDGEPGTGKTTFGSYIASSGIFDRIIVCNLVQASKLNFSDLITNLERQIAVSAPKDKKADADPETILLIIDEIDKWLESYTSNQIQNLREEARGKKQTTDGKTSGMMVESFEKLTEQEENDKRVHIKNEFLDQLYKLVEGNMFSDIRKYVIIFNTNNFNKLFENVDERFDALRDRFTKYKFSRIGKNDIITYFECFRSKLLECKTNNTQKVISSTLENIKALCNYDLKVYEKIPESLAITYRTLFKLFRNNNFNVAQTINSLSTGDDFEIFPMGNDVSNMHTNTNNNNGQIVAV